jgi:Fe-S cluster assembly protein SufD
MTGNNCNSVNKCQAGFPCGDCSACSAATLTNQETLIEIKPGSDDGTPIEIPGTGKVTLAVGADASATIVEPATGSACVGVKRFELAASVGQNARVRFVSVRECAAHGERDYVSTFDLGENSSLEIIECRLGGGSVNVATTVNLRGKHSEVVIRSALLAAETDRLRSSVSVNHLASLTKSRIMTKGVLAGEARIEYRGLVSIGRENAGCGSEQHADALLLSRDARADMMPDLQIDACDVRCGHGSAVSGLDKNKLYYLMSRGLSQVTAMEAVARGFLSDVIVSLSESELEQVERVLSPRLMCALSDREVND